MERIIKVLSFTRDSSIGPSGLPTREQVIDVYRDQAQGHSKVVGVKEDGIPGVDDLNKPESHANAQGPVVVYGEVDRDLIEKSRQARAKMVGETGDGGVDNVG
jgi:hypothetical protein